jgi:hypothetical protein
MDSTVSAVTDKTGTERAGCHAPAQPLRNLGDDPQAPLSSDELSLMYLFAGKAIPEPVSHAW